MTARNRQHGMVLVTSLLLLVVVTILALSMFRSFGIDEKIAGNVREKTRALGAAETAEQLAENWLAQGNAGIAVNCNGPLTYPTVQICSNMMTPALAAAVPWAGRVNYQPLTPNPMTLNPGNAGVQNTYYQLPAFYISYLGGQPGGGNGSIYQIDAVGYGGDPNTVAVVETTYLVQTSSNVNNLGALTGGGNIGAPPPGGGTPPGGGGGGD